MAGMRLRPPVVLAYHGVGPHEGDNDPETLLVSEDRLRDQLTRLQRIGYRFITAGELAVGYDGDRPPDGIAVATFDDGLRNNLTNAVPVLESLGIRATFYVCPGLWGLQHGDIAGEQGALLTSEEAARLVERGMELGAHSLTHPDLRLLPAEELRRQIEGSKTQIEAITGEPCTTFAYPFGLFDGREEKAVEDAGFDLALAWTPGPWRRYATPRMPTPPRHGGLRLLLKMAGVRRRAL